MHRGHSATLEPQVYGSLLAPSESARLPRHHPDAICHQIDESRRQPRPRILPRNRGQSRLPRTQVCARLTRSSDAFPVRESCLASHLIDAPRRGGTGPFPVAMSRPLMALVTPLPDAPRPPETASPESPLSRCAQAFPRTRIRGRAPHFGRIPDTRSDTPSGTECDTGRDTESCTDSVSLRVLPDVSQSRLSRQKCAGKATLAVQNPAPKTGLSSALSDASKAENRHRILHRNTAIAEAKTPLHWPIHPP